jgi:hypothetical protein
MKLISFLKALKMQDEQVLESLTNAFFNQILQAVQFLLKEQSLCHIGITCDRIFLDGELNIKIGGLEDAIFITDENQKVTTKKEIL